jgi:hypothetical protein
MLQVKMTPITESPTATFTVTPTPTLTPTSTVPNGNAEYFYDGDGRDLRTPERTLRRGEIW